MKQASTSFIEKIHKRSRNFKFKLDFGDFQITNAQNFKLTNISCPSSGLTFGTVAIGNGSFELKNYNTNIEGKTFRPYIGLSVNDAIEWVKLGKYKITKPEKKGIVTSLSFEDDIALLDVKFLTEYTYPVSAVTVLTDIENICGVSIDKTGIPQTLKVGKSVSGRSCREIIGLIAQLVGRFAVIDSNSEKITFKWYENTDYKIKSSVDSAQNNLYMIKEPNAGKSFTLGAISCQVGEDVIDAVSDNATGVMTLSNMLMTQQMLNDVFNSRNGFSYTECDVDFVLGNPLLDAWDIVTIEYKGNTYVVPCMELIHSFNGGFSTQVKSFVRNENTAFEGTITKEINNIKTTVTVLDGKIETEVSKKVNGNEIISTINQSAEEIKIIAEKVELNGAVTFNSFDSATKSQIAIDTKIEYALSTSTTTAPTAGWSETAPTWQDGKYMWQKITVTYADGSDDVSTTCIAGATGATGATGAQGEPGEKGEKGDKGDKGDRGLQGLQGPKGEQGIAGANGTNGTDGKTSYFHIKYSPVANPTAAQMTETPSAYIGTYVDFTETDSTDPTKYTWSRFEGAQGKDGKQGIAGTNGADGKTSYLHIAYANNANGTSGFSVSDATNKLYIGQYTDYTVNDSTDPTKYKWTKIKGDKGATGATGAAGVSITGVTEHYAVSTSNTTAPTTWQNTPPTMTATNKYLWNYETIAYSNGTTSDTQKRVIGVYGDKGATGNTGATGATGAAGRSITGVTNYYLATNSNSGVTTSTSGWTTTVQNVSSSKKYLWNYEKITYDSGDPTITTPCIIGAYGDKGATGATGAAGKGISSTAITYQASTSGTTVPTGAWSTSIPTVAQGSYLWTRTVITYTDNTTSTSYSVSRIGANGTNGTNGATGKGVKSIVEQYYLSTSATNTSGGSWSTVSPAWQSGKYIWQRQHITWSDDTETYTTAVIANALNSANSTANTAKSTADSAKTAADAANGVLANWCYQNNKTIIDGGKIATGSITAQQINVADLFARMISSPVDPNVYIDMVNGEISATKIQYNEVSGDGITFENELSIVSDGGHPRLQYLNNGVVVFEAFPSYGSSIDPTFRIGDSSSNYVDIWIDQVNRRLVFNGELGSGTANSYVLNFYIDQSGIHSNLKGNADTATKLQTARNITIGKAAKSFNGTANIAFTLAEMGAAESAHGHYFHDDRIVYKAKTNGQNNLNWFKVCSFSCSVTSAPSSARYDGLTIYGDIIYEKGNYYQDQSIKVPFNITFRAIDGTVVADKVVMYLPKTFTYDCIRVVKVSVNNYELQIRQTTAWTRCNVLYSYITASSAITVTPCSPVEATNTTVVANVAGATALTAYDFALANHTHDKVVYESKNDYGIYCDGNMTANSNNSVTFNDTTSKRFRFYIRTPYGLMCHEMPVDRPQQTQQAKWGSYQTGVMFPAGDSDENGINRHYICSMMWCMKKTSTGWTCQVTDSGWMHLGLGMATAAQFAQNAADNLSTNTYGRWQQRHNNMYSIYKIVGCSI